jgi:LysR family nitrogen assimilation transcriptional regulator
MNLRQLEIFIAIVEEGSLTKAADRVHIVQPALTQQIKALEEEFGLPLLVRSSRGVRPTEAGRRLVMHAQPLLDDFAALRAHVVGIEEEPTGEVRVGMPGTASALVTPRLISAAAKRFPRVRVHIVEPMVGLITHWLDETRVDFAVSYRPTHPGGAEVEEVLTESIYLCCPPGSPEATPDGRAGDIPFAHACGLPLVVPHRGYSIREILEGRARQMNCKLNISIEIDSHGPAKALVEQGLGYAFLPPMTTVAEREQGRLVMRAVDPAVGRSVFLAANRTGQLGAAATAIRALCREIMIGLVRDGAWEARLAGDNE